MSLVFFMFQIFKFCGRLICLLFDLGEELQERLGIRLKHLLRAQETHLSHFVVVGEALDLSILGLIQLLCKENLPFFLLQLVTGFLILGSFSWHSKIVVLVHVDLGGNFGVDSNTGGLDVRLTELAQAAFSDRAVLFPQLQFLVLLTFLNFPGFFVLLKSEDKFI